jgi:RNA polymerase sigma factor (sigma-70 family)
MSERFRVNQHSDLGTAALSGKSKSAFQSLMEEIAGGSEAAVESLLSLYGKHLSRAVRRRLNQGIRSKFDTSDFVQAVWASFFCGREALATFENSGQFVAFLTRMAKNKVIDECRRRFQTQKNDVNRERTLGGDASQEVAIPGREPTPSQVAIGHEEWERMIGGVPSHYREILELRALGETQEEIAQRLGVSEKTVRRVLKRVRDRRE